MWNGRLCNTTFHNVRFRRSAKEVFGWNTESLEELIRIPKEAQTGLYKCRIIYGSCIERIEFHPYRLRPIQSLKIVAGDDIDYSYKFENREAIERLFRLCGECDDVLIIKNGYITDTSIANIAFYDGIKWITPSSPLLKGTQREKLLSEGRIVEDDIKPLDLGVFKKARLFNAMIDFGEIELPVQNIMAPELRA